MTSRQAPVNPYHFGAPIRDPDDFFGRQQELSDTFEHVRKRECVNVVGERRCGKTSFLYHLQHPQVREQYIPHDPNSIYVYLNAEISQQSPAGFFREVFTKTKAQCVDLPISPHEGAMDEQRVRAALEALRPRRLVLLIDEFECIAECERFPHRFFVFLRGLSSSYDISFVIATRRGLFEYSSHDFVSSPFPNIFRAIELGCFAEGELQEFIQRTCVESGAPMLEVLDEIVKMAGRFPYLVQMACWHCFRVWSESGGLGPEVLPIARRRFEDEARPHFEAVWRRYLSDEERRTLRLMAGGEKLGRPDVARRLQRRGYVASGKVASEVFADYVMQQGPRGAGMRPVTPGVPGSGLWVDAESGNVYVEGRLVDPPLTKHQYRLVKLLFDKKGNICDAFMIVNAVWTGEYLHAVDDQRIAQLVSRARRRIEPEGKPWKYIITVRGRGFTLGTESLTFPDA